MELSSIIGPVMGIAAVIGTAMIKHVPLESLWGVSALCIVGLGTLGAVMTAYPMKDFIFSFKSLGLFLKGPAHDAESLIGDVERLAQLARKDGFLALEKEVEKLENPILQKGVRMLVDNTDPAVIQEVLEAEIAIAYEEEEIAGEGCESKLENWIFIEIRILCPNLFTIKTHFVGPWLGHSW